MKYQIAGVDLGSNSFRMLLGEVTTKNGYSSLKVIEKVKETVRLAGGLDDNNMLSDDAISIATSTLKMFGEKIKHFNPQHVRAVATNTFRIAKNQRELLIQSEQALGFPIEIIAGHEEARLIYQGVAHALNTPSERRLVVDIGGGSTEFIIGTGLEPHILYSLPIGCLSFSRRFFPDGVITPERMQEAEEAAFQELEAIRYAYKKMGWQTAYGSSGTSKALYAILTASGFEKSAISLSGMDKLKQRLFASKTVENAELAGIKSDRIPVLAGGLAIMRAIFISLGIKQMQPADGALRLGVLHDLLARDESKDIRDVTVNTFLNRYHVDTENAKRLKRLTVALYTPWLDKQQNNLAELLGWAAQLSDIGMSISHTNYTQHSEYIVEYADMPGFSTSDQLVLAYLVRGLTNRTTAELLRRYPHLKEALLCLRLARLICRGHSTGKKIPIIIEPNEQKITLHIGQAWFRLTLGAQKLLDIERTHWAQCGYELIMAINSDEDN